MRAALGDELVTVSGRSGTALFAIAFSIVATGCAAPLIGAAVSGAGMLGAHKGMNAIQRQQLADSDRLRSISAGALRVSADDITISDKRWRKGVLHWIAANQKGQQSRCEMGEANLSCTPFGS